MMGHCKDCKFWKDAMYAEEKKACDVIGEESKSGTYIDARADDDSGLWTQLITAADFGCNKFKDVLS